MGYQIRNRHQRVLFPAYMHYSDFAPPLMVNGFFMKIMPFFLQILLTFLLCR